MPVDQPLVLSCGCWPMRLLLLLLLPLHPSLPTFPPHHCWKSSPELKRAGIRKLSRLHSSSNRFCSGVPARKAARHTPVEAKGGGETSRHPHACRLNRQARHRPDRQRPADAHCLLSAPTCEQQAVLCRIGAQFGVELAACILQAVPLINHQVAPPHSAQAWPVEGSAGHSGVQAAAKSWLVELWAA